MPTHYPIGTPVVVTEESFEHIWHGNRSIFGFPSDAYVTKARDLIGKPGKVTMQFLPGYEVNVTFEDGTILHMKEHWFVPSSNPIPTRATESSFLPT